MLLTNPHNTTGRLWNKSELIKLHSLAQKYNLYVCSDEILSGLIMNLDIKYIPFASINKDTASRTVTLIVSVLSRGGQ